MIDRYALDLVAVVGVVKETGNALTGKVADVVVPVKLTPPLLAVDMPFVALDPKSSEATIVLVILLSSFLFLFVSVSGNPPLLYCAVYIFFTVDFERTSFASSALLLRQGHPENSS